MGSRLRRAPDSRHGSAELALAQVCEPMENTGGICAKTWLQAPFDCTRSDSGSWQAGRRWNLSSISACAARCLQCERCAWVSYGRRECAWYASCDHPVNKPAYERMRVRDAPAPGPRLEAGHTCGQGRMPKAVTPAPLPVPAPECPASDTARQSFLALTGRRRRLACIGDSITRGDGAHEPGRGSHVPFKRGIVGRGNYPAALQALLGTEDWLVGNFGVSGRTAMPTGDAYAVRAAELAAHAVHVPCTCTCTCRAHAVHMLSGHARVPVSALLRTGAGCPYARHQRRQACAPARQTRRPRSGRAGRLRLLSGRRPSRLRPAALWALEPELWDRVGPTVWPWSPTEALALPSPNPLRVELPGALGAQAELPTRAACAGTRRPRSPGPSVSREVGK